MRYLCLVYHDEQKLNALSEDEYQALAEETLTYSDELSESGHLLDANPLEYVETATSLRLGGGKVSITDGPFVETKEQVGGYYLIEAKDLNEAIRLASKMPPIQMGGIEVRPIKENLKIRQSQSMNEAS